MITIAGRAARTLTSVKGLLLRLSAVDADAEAAVRVIAYFDALLEHRATLADLVRATAALAECPAGLERVGQPTIRFRPNGLPLDHPPANSPTNPPADGFPIDPASPDGVTGGAALCGAAVGTGSSPQAPRTRSRGTTRARDRYLTWAIEPVHGKGRYLASSPRFGHA
jgi:hypothetical protein